MTAPKSNAAAIATVAISLNGTPEGDGRSSTRFCVAATKGGGAASTEGFGAIETGDVEIGCSAIFPDAGAPPTEGGGGTG